MQKYCLNHILDTFVYIISILTLNEQYLINE